MSTISSNEVVVLEDGASARWLRIRAVTRRHFTEMLHTPSRANDLLVWPFIDTLLFGSLGVFLSRQVTGQISVSYVLSGLFLYHVVYQSAVALSVGFMSETAERNLLNLMATPLRTAEYAAGLVMFGLMRMCIGLAIIATLAATLFSYNVVEGGWRLLPIILGLVGVGVSLSFVLIGLQLRLGRAAEPATWAIAVFVPTISGAFYPIDALPGFLQPISRLLPTTHAFTAARQLVADGPMPWDEIALTAMGAVAMLGIGVLVLRWAVQTFCRRGLVTRYS